MSIHAAEGVLSSLRTFFSAGCKILNPGIGTDSIPVELPLAGYDDQNVVVFVERDGERLILHDGGRFVAYLANHDILVQSRQQKYRDYLRFFEDLASRHRFSFSEQHRRFETIISGDGGKESLVFVECLVALSFLVMTKSAGLRGFGYQEAQHLSALKTALTAVFPDVRIASGIVAQVQERPVPQDLGLTLTAPSKQTRGCIHYVQGRDWAHVVRSAILFDEFSRNERWFSVTPGCVWGVYGGPMEFFDDTQRLLRSIGNGRAAQLIDFESGNQLVGEMSERLQVPPQHRWEHLLKVRREPLPETASVSNLAGARTSQDQDLWSLTTFAKREHSDEASNAGVEGAAERLLQAPAYDSKLVIEPLESYGTPFAQYILDHIRAKPTSVSRGRFNRIADEFLQYFNHRGDFDALNSIDSKVADIEEEMTPPLKSDYVFRQEEEAVNGFVVAELRSLRKELARLSDAQSGRQ